MGEDEKAEENEERLTFKDIQNITKSMIKHNKVQAKNFGVLHSIKGKMYCLKLGEVSKSKELSHYFYTSQYKRQLKNNFTNHGVSQNKDRNKGSFTENRENSFMTDFRNSTNNK